MIRGPTKDFFNQFFKMKFDYQVPGYYIGVQEFFDASNEYRDFELRRREVHLITTGKTHELLCIKSLFDGQNLWPLVV